MKPKTCANIVWKVKVVSIPLHQIVVPKALQAASIEHRPHSIRPRSLAFLNSNSEALGTKDTEDFKRR